MTFPLDAVIGDVEDLRRRYREPSALVRRKKQTSLDEATRAFIAACPFVLLATADTTGACDVSPRGGPRGFVRVLDERHVAVPDLNGNNLLDSLENIVTNPHAGLLFVIPGRDETVRLDGRAWVSASSGLLDRWDGELRRPATAIVVEVANVFVHCAKSFRRGHVWDPPSWDEVDAPDGVDLIRCHLELQAEKSALREAFEDGYAEELAADRPGPDDVA